MQVTGSTYREIVFQNVIVSKGVPAPPPFQGTHPLTQLASLFKIFESPSSYLFHTPFKVF